MKKGIVANFTQRHISGRLPDPLPADTQEPHRRHVHQRARIYVDMRRGHGGTCVRRGAGYQATIQKGQDPGQHVTRGQQLRVPELRQGGR